MDIRPEEKQAINELKQTIIKFKKWIISCVVLIALPIMIYQGYQSYQEQISLKASTYFQTLVTAIDNEDFQKVLDLKSEILEQDLNTPYSKEIRFLLANAQYQKAQSDEAIKTLNTILENEKKKDSIYYHLASLQLIRIYIDNKKFSLAEDMINTPSENRQNYQSIYSYYQALVHAVLGRNQRAKEEFLKVIELSRDNPQLVEIARSQKALVQ